METNTHRLNQAWDAAALAVICVTSAIPPAHASAVWNHDFGGQVTTIDNFAGAAEEKATPSSIWNAITNPSNPNQALFDATGASGTTTATFTTCGTMVIPTFAVVSGLQLIYRYPWAGKQGSPVTESIGGLNASGIIGCTRTEESGLACKIVTSTNRSGWSMDAVATQSPGVAGVETVTAGISVAPPPGGKLFVRGSLLHQ